LLAEIDFHGVAGMERFKNRAKLVATISPSAQADVLEYHRQERKRYLVPLYPFIYTFEGR
jgi:hypothetical protein